MNKSLKQKVINAYEEIIEHREFALPTEAEIKGAMPLPDDFKAKLQERAKRDKKYIEIWGKRISKAAIIILIILMTGLTVYAVMQSKFFYKIFKRNTVVSTIGEEMQKGEEHLNHLYYPAYLLDFEMDDTISTDTAVYTMYSNEKGEAITFMQQVIQTQLLFDNEDTAEEKVAVNGVEAIRFTKHGETTLIWCEYGYLYELNVPEKYREELIRMAESLEINEEKGEEHEEK